MSDAQPIQRPSANLGQRITRVLLPGLVALIIIEGVALHTAVKNVLISQFDLALLTKVRTLTSFPEPERVGINLGFTEKPLPEFHGGQHTEYFQVWLSDGTVLARSPSLPPEQNLARQTGPADAPAYWSLRLPNGRPGRAVGVRMNSEKQRGKGDFTVDLVLARDSSQLGRLLNNLALGMAASGGAVLALAWWGVRHATSRALQPVSELASDVASIDAASLKKRVQANGLPADLRPIAEQINHLMHRLEGAFERERRFASNSAHELLTPVSELRVAAENALEWPNDPQATAGLASEARELAIQMEHVVRSLLALSRAEANLTRLRVELIDLSTLIHETLQANFEKAHARSLRFETKLPPALEIESDQVLLGSILKNLIQNSLEYALPGGTIKISATATKADVEIVVTNQTSPITPEEIARFGEPFWRRDTAHQSREHAGLGLALSKAFAHLLGGELAITAESATRITVKLLLSQNLPARKTMVPA